MTKIHIKLPPQSESPSLEKTIRQHLDVFFKKNTGIAEADVKFSHGSAAISDKTCEFYVKTSSKNRFTIQKAVSFEAAMVKAIVKLQTQLDTI